MDTLNTHKQSYAQNQTHSHTHTHTNKHIHASNKDNDMIKSVQSVQLLKIFLFVFSSLNFEILLDLVGHFDRDIFRSELNSLNLLAVSSLVLTISSR